MTFEQFAIATNSDEGWLNNARRLLGRSLHRTPSGAKWWGMVRALNHELGLPLNLAAQAADAIFADCLSLNRITISASVDGSVALRIDLERMHSTANARLSAATAFCRPRRLGRPPKERVSDPVREASVATRIRVESSPHRLERVARELRASNAYPRGIQCGLPFIMDAATLRAVPRLALTTLAGDVDVIVMAARKS
jgi:hypothetical protein